MRGLQKCERLLIFNGRPSQGKRLIPDWLDWLSYLAGTSKSYHEISISCIFLQSPYQVDTKKVAKYWKDFLCYSNTLETYSVLLLCLEIFAIDSF